MKKNVQAFLDHLSTPIIRAILKEVYPLLSSGYKTEYKEEMIELKEENVRQQLASILSSEKELALIYSHLSAYELEALKYFIFQVSEDFLTYRQIEQGMEGIRPTIFRLGLTGLRRKGLIFTVRRQWGEVAYVLPSDLGDLLYSLYSKTEEISEIESCLEPVTKDKEEYPPVYIDLFLLLDEIRTEKNSSIPLTKKGSIHKRYVRAWQERLTDRQPKLEQLSFAFGHRDTYSQQVVILLDFLTRKKIIRWYQDQLYLDQKIITEWMNLSRVEMKKQFLAYWSSYFPPPSWLARYQKDMFSRAEGEWTYLLSFVEHWESEYSLPSIKQIKQLIIKELLDPLVGLGLIEKGITEQQEEVWRWKEEQESIGQVWVQPTLELYCPSFLSFSVLWELTRLLTLQRWENMLILSLSKPKVQATIERGESIKEWVTWLETTLRCPLPQDFKEQLYVWQRNQEQVVVSQKTIIEIEDEQLAKAWQQWPETEKFHVRQINTTLFLVDLNKQDQIIRLFAQKGFPVKQLEDDGYETNLVEEDVSVITFVLERSHDYKVESVFPDMTEAVPVWSTLPDVWKKQFTAYHEQTKRNMVEQAVQHDLKLKVETRLGDILEILPTHFQVVDGRWICYDEQDKKHELEHIRKLQLLFPV